MPRRPLPAAIVTRDEEGMFQLLKRISDAVEEQGAEISDMKNSHNLMAERLGQVSSDGKGGTGLVGQVIDLRTDVQGFKGLKSLMRGFLIGGAVVAAILLLGVAGALKALGAGVFVGL
jgi:hypothetical protein